MYTDTYVTSKILPLYRCHKIIERGINGRQIMVKDTTTELVGTVVEDEWEYLNNTDEKVALVYNRHLISTDGPSIRKMYELNFDPDAVTFREQEGLASDFHVLLIAETGDGRKESVLINRAFLPKLSRYLGEKKLYRKLARRSKG
jgi:hypothetical protein